MLCYRLSLAFVLLVSVLLCPRAEADLVSSMKNAVNGVANSLSGAIDSMKNFGCVVQNADKFNECSQIMDKFNQKATSDNEIKEYCCAFHDTKVCVENVANEKCGADAAGVIAEFMKKFSENVMPEDCEKYDSFFTCADKTILIGGGIVAGIILLTVLGCLFCCLKRLCC